MGVRDRFVLKVGASALGSLLAFSITQQVLDGSEIADLEAGSCISADMSSYPPSHVEIADCSRLPRIRDYRVVFTQRVLGERYPGNLARVERQCADRGGTLLAPSRQSWEAGERVAICYRFWGIPGRRTSQ